MEPMRLQQHAVLAVHGPSAASSVWPLPSSIPCPCHICEALSVGVLSEYPWGGPLVWGYRTSLLLIVWSISPDEATICVLAIADVLSESIHVPRRRRFCWLLMPLRGLTSLIVLSIFEFFLQSRIEVTMTVKISEGGKTMITLSV